MAEETNNQLAVIQNSIELLKSAPEILQANQIRKNKAIETGNKILATIGEEGMSITLDERCNNYLANINKASTSMKDERAGVTQIMDQLKKMYTEVEAEIDIKRADTVPAKIQAHRNAFAAAEAKRKAEEAKAAQLVADRAKEALEIKAKIELKYTEHYQNYLYTRKQNLHDSFNKISLETYGEKALLLKKFNPAMKEDAVREIELRIPSVIHSSQELKEFADEVFRQKVAEFTSNYAAELNLLKDELVDKLPSKLNALKEEKRLADEAAAELERQRIEKEKKDAEIAAAGAKEKARLQAEQEEQRIENEKRNAILKAEQDKAAQQKLEREQEEQRKLEADLAQSREAAEQDIEIKKQGEAAMIMFEQSASTAELSSGAQVRQGVDLVVLHPVGYTQIFAFWFENEGKNLGVDKIGATKMDQMKAFCEKKALKDNTTIESKFLQYNDSFKAVNKKVKDNG